MAYRSAEHSLPGRESPDRQLLDPAVVIACGSEPARESGVSFSRFVADTTPSRAGSLLQGNRRKKKAPPGITPGGAFVFPRRAHPRKPASYFPSFTATQGLLEPCGRCW